MAGFQGTSTRRNAHEALWAAIEAERRDMLTSARGRVISYDKDTQTAKIKPLLKQRFGDKDLEAPDLEEVPVRWTRAGGITIHHPLEKDDEVDLHFASRSLDPYQVDGESIDNAPARMHDLSDASAVPNGSSEKRKLSGMPADRTHIGTVDGKSGLRMKKDGQWELHKDGDALLVIMGDFARLFQNHHNEGLPLDEQGEAAAIVARIEAMRAA